MTKSVKKDDTASLLLDPNNGSSLLDKQEILLQFHISNRTLQRWRSSGQIAYYKIGKKIYYSQVDISNMLINSRVTKLKNK